MSDARAESALALTFDLPDEAATAGLAMRLAGFVRAGDVLLLHGDLGTGKTAFARALINALPGAQEEVPSPTFTLVQVYQRGDLEVWHCDLYRLEASEEIEELGLEEAFVDALTLIEWPERLGPYCPRGALTVALKRGAGETARHMILSGDEHWAARLESLAA